MHMTVYECEGPSDTHEVLRTARPTCVLIAAGPADTELFALIDAWRNVPFIALTQTDSGGQEAMRHGAEDHLDESALDTRILERSIRYAVERKLHGRAMETLAHQDRLASLGRLSATVAHEINNPLSFIAANLDTLQTYVLATGELLQTLDADPVARDVVERFVGQSPLPLAADEAKALIQQSADGCQRIVSIVRQLRSFARKSDEDERPRETCLSDVVGWACALTERQVAQRGTLIKRLTDERVFLGRPGRLAQVATNLLLNAAQALPSNQPHANSVWVSTESDGEASYLIVEDTGPGFDWATRRRALDPFFTTKPQGEGTGLGLSIVHDIVQSHGGSLTLDNRASGGARVVVRIPHATPFAPLPSVPPPTSEQDPALRILLIDDEVALRRAYQRWLRPHEVVAESASEALRRLLEQSDRNFDLVLCDLSMPDISGIEVQQRLLDGAPELMGRFVFLTGGALSEELSDALASTSARVLNKPATKDEILAVARQVRGDSST